MATQHKNITEANLHEPKGVSTSAVDKVYVANGAGSGTWKKVPTTGLEGLADNGTSGEHVLLDGSGGFLKMNMAHGSISFTNIAAPYTLTYPAAYTKLVPTTVATTDALDFTEATTARLTYTGIPTGRHMRILAAISFEQTSGANRDIRFAVFQNGVIHTKSTGICTTQTGLKKNVSLICDIVNVQTNDYFEVFAQNDGATGDINIYTYYLTVFTLN